MKLTAKSRLSIISIFSQTCGLVLCGLLIAGFLSFTHAFGGEDDLLIKFSADTPPGIVRQFLADNDAALTGTIDEIGVTMIRAKPGHGSGILKAIEKNREKWGIVYAEVDGEMQAVPLPVLSTSNGQAVPLPVEGSPSATAEWFATITHAPPAHEAGFDGQGVAIAVLDSGADLNHPFIAPRVADTACFVPAPLGDTSFKADAQDVDGHGTATFTLAAQMAPEASIHVGRVMYHNSASWSAVSKGILWAKDRAQIISISIGGSSNSFSLTDAISKANAVGCVVYVAAGNYSNSTPQYPAQTVGATAVSATTETDSLCGFSSFGNGTTSIIDITAPGQNLRAGTIGGGWGYFSGTSGSTPIAAGATATVLQKWGGTGLQALARMQSGAVNLGNALKFGAGRVDLVKPLALAIDEPPPPSSAIPAVPAAPTASAITTTSFSINWSPVPGATSYDVYRGNYRFQSTKAPSTSVVFPWAAPDSDYKIRVLASNGWGSSALSEPLYVHTPASDDAPPTETWTTVTEDPVVSYSPYAPTTATQTRTKTTSVRTYEKSSTGEIRNDNTATTETTEERTVALSPN